MAAIDFPSTPTLNQVVVRGGYSWQWNGTVWKKIVVAGSGMPDGTADNDLIQWDSGSGSWVPDTQANVIGSYVSTQVATKTSTGKAIAMAIVFGG